jgi:hypothetical protein
MQSAAFLSWQQRKWSRMSPSSSSSPQLHSDVRLFLVDDSKNSYVKAGVEYWRSLCAEKQFPARVDLTLRGMAPFLPHVVILSVIDDGADYEFRYVGDAQRQAFGTHFKGLRITQIEAAVPKLGAILRLAYEQVRSLGMPFGVRGPVDHETSSAKPQFHETAFLPLGISEAAVDHILVVGVQIPEPFWQISSGQLATLADGIRPATAQG